MKVNNKKTVFGLLIAALVMVNVSCGDALKPGWEYMVDNPLDKEITFKIDNKEYTIPADSTMPIKVTQGKHTLTYNGSSANFITKVNSNKSVTIMNPTLSNYMIHAYVYISSKSRSKDVSAIYEENSHEYNSNEGLVKLPVKVVNSLFIDKTNNHWAFFLDQEAKPEVSTSSPGKKIVFPKIFREADYMKEFVSELPQGVVFPKNTKSLSEQAPYIFPTEALLSDCEGGNKYVKEIGDRCAKILASSEDVFQDIAQLAFYALSEAHPNMTKECSTQYNPGRDDKLFKEKLGELSKEMTFLTNSSSFIVK